MLIRTVRPVIRGAGRSLAAGRSQPRLQRLRPPSVEAEAAFESGLTRLQGRDYAGAVQAFERASLGAREARSMRRSHATAC